MQSVDINTEQHHQVFPQIVDLLLELGADIYTKNSLNQNVLHKAVEHGNISILKFILKKSDNINTDNKYSLINDKDINGDSSFMKLTHFRRSNNYDIFKLLIEHGGDILTQDNQGYNFLFRAVEYNQKEIVKALLQPPFSLDINQTDLYGNTLMLFALKKWHVELAICILDEYINRGYDWIAFLKARNLYGEDVFSWLLANHHKSFLDSIMLLLSSKIK
jgi:ankyrin repeat protein